MSRTYNVALAAAGLIFLLSVVYYATQPEPTGADDALALANTQPPTLAAAEPPRPDPGQAAINPPLARQSTAPADLLSQRNTPPTNLTRLTPPGQNTPDPDPE
ncbi:MAG: hypothetical protein AAF823_13705, partial [Planctomycetota bacterium]